MHVPVVRYQCNFIVLHTIATVDYLITSICDTRDNHDYVSHSLWIHQSTTSNNCCNTYNYIRIDFLPNIVSQCWTQLHVQCAPLFGANKKQKNQHKHPKKHKNHQHDHCTAPNLVVISLSYLQLLPRFLFCLRLMSNKTLVTVVSFFGLSFSTNDIFYFIMSRCLLCRKSPKIEKYQKYQIWF